MGQSANTFGNVRNYESLPTSPYVSTEMFEQVDGQDTVRSQNRSLLARRDKIELSRELQPFEKPRFLGQSKIVSTRRDKIQHPAAISTNHIRIQSDTVNLMDRNNKPKQTVSTKNGLPGISLGSPRVGAEKIILSQIKINDGALLSSQNSGTDLQEISLDQYNSRARIKHGLKSNNLVRQINMQRRLQQQLRFNSTSDGDKSGVLKGISLSSPRAKKVSVAGSNSPLK